MFLTKIEMTYTYSLFAESMKINAETLASAHRHEGMQKLQNIYSEVAQKKILMHTSSTLISPFQTCFDNPSSGTKCVEVPLHI